MSFEAFISETITRFIRRLRVKELKNWEGSNIITLAYASVNELKPKINEYLKGKNVTIANADQLIEEVIENVLIPHLKISD